MAIEVAPSTLSRTAMYKPSLGKGPLSHMAKSGGEMGDDFLLPERKEALFPKQYHRLDGWLDFSSPSAELLVLFLEEGSVYFYFF